jgi:hypothetical protein
MTSIIQVMNTRGVAFATDSAVSWGSHSRNSAQKLFSLTGRQPIAYMVMGNGTFAPSGLSWDRIFHKYNVYYIDKYGAEKELDTVDDYEKDFINFLESQVSPEFNEKSLVNDIWTNWAGNSGIMSNGGYFNSPDESGNDVDTEVSNIIESQFSKEEHGIFNLKRLIEDYSSAVWMSSPLIDDIEFQYKIKQVKKNHTDTIELAASWIMMSAITLGTWDFKDSWEEKYETLSENLQSESAAIRKMLLIMLERWLSSWGNNHSWKYDGSKSDVIFGGFGKNDVYPKTIHIVTGSRVSGLGNSNQLVLCKNIVDPNVNFPEYESETLTWRCSSFLEPLAQNEFIIRMTTGMSSTMGGNNIPWFVQNGLEGWLMNGALEDLSKIPGMSEEMIYSITTHLKNIEMPRDFSSYLNSWILDQQNSVKNEFRTAVKRLSPVELAEFSSDLIGVQATMHNIVNSQASVDLPVDACHLSKENGFIWHSRKNMPDLNLNPKLNTMNWKGTQYL